MSGASKSSGIRWPNLLRTKIENRATAARMCFSTYVIAKMSDEEPEFSPALAALGEITAIKEHLLAGGAPSDHIARLERLVLDLCRAAAMEARQ